MTTHTPVDVDVLALSDCAAEDCQHDDAECPTTTLSVCLECNTTAQNGRPVEDWEGSVASDIPQAVFTSIFKPSSVGVKIGRAADMADIACRICHHAESDHTRAHAVKKYGFDTRQACTQCACVEWVAPKEVESVDDVAAVDLIDDLDDARRTMSSVEFDDDLYARTRDFILDAVSENQRLNAVLAHRTAQLDRLTLAKRGS